MTTTTLKAIMDRAVRVLKSRYTLAALISIAFCLIILPINEHAAFSSPIGHKAVLLSHLLKVLFAVFLWLVVVAIITFVTRLRQGNRHYRRWLVYSGVYFLVLFVIFLCIYPGHWVWDEFNILRAVKSYTPDAWENYFTNIFYTFCLYLIPTGVSIVFFQITFVSVVAGYVLSHVRAILKRSNLFYILAILFLLPPVLLNNLYPLRLTMYSYLELLLICKLLLLQFQKPKPASSYPTLLWLSIVITIVAFWRSEAIYYLLALPLAAIKLHIFTKKTSNTLRPYIYTVLSLAIVASGAAIINYTSSPRYTLTAYMNPLSIMVQHKLKGPLIAEHLADMNNTVNMALVKQYPDYEETPAYWKGGVRDNFAATLKSFEKDYAYVVLHNPTLFLKARMKTFLSTNGVHDIVTPLPLGAWNGADPHGNNDGPVINNFEETNALSKPFNRSLKLKTTRVLLMDNSSGKSNFVGHIFWNVITPIILLSVLFVWKLLRREFYIAILILFVLARAPLLFLTAPANYFMYYLPIYISGFFLTLVALVLYLDKRLVARGR